MRDFDNQKFNDLLQVIVESNATIINIEESGNYNFALLKYFLVYKRYSASIIDEYPFEINDASTLMEALYFQLSLFTVHSLSWDAFDEGIGEKFRSDIYSNGLVLLFRKGQLLREKHPDQFEILNQIGEELNRENPNKPFRIILG